MNNNKLKNIFSVLLTICFKLVQSQMINFNYSNSGMMINKDIQGNVVNAEISSIGNFCENSLVNLNASYFDFYFWSNGLTQPSFSYFAQVGDTTFTVVGSNENGCTDSASITISVPPTPVLQALNGPVAVTPLQTYNYSAQPVDSLWSYVWEIQGGIISGGFNSSNPQVIWAETGIGLLCVTAYNENGCPSDSICIEVPLSILPIQAHSGAMLVYPNPSSDQVHIQLQSREEWIESVQVFNASGALVFNGVPANKGQNSFTIPNQSVNASGMYFTKVKSNKKSYQQKIIVQH
jgi:hypothetical protein